MYRPFLWWSIFSDLLVGFFSCFVNVNPIDRNQWGPTIAYSFAFAVQHFLTEGIALVMMQQGCGYQAAQRSALTASVWAVLTFCTQIARFRSADLEYVISINLWSISLVAFYSLLAFAPIRLIYRRSSVYRYASFWAFFRIISMVSDDLGKIKIKIKNTLE